MKFHIHQTIQSLLKTVVNLTLISVCAQGQAWDDERYDFHNNNGRYGSCREGICLGQKIYNLKRNYREALVIGIENTGTFVVRFLDNNMVSSGWSRTDLAIQFGCNKQICIGQTVYNLQRSYRSATVVALEANGYFVLRFQDNSMVSGGWSALALAVNYGCGQFYCVGNIALNNQRNYREVRVIGIQADQRYVVQFLDNGTISGNWSDSHLVRTGQGGREPHPYPRYPRPPRDRRALSVTPETATGQMIQ